METKERGRHRLGGKHSDPIHVPTESKKPSGRRAAKLASDTAPVAVVPAVPTRKPTIHTIDTVVAPPKTSMIRVVKHKGTFNALAAIATGGFLIAGGSTAPAATNHTDIDAERTATASDLELELSAQNPITVPIDILMNQEKVDVKTSPAPPPPPPPVVVKKVIPAPVVPKVVAKVITPATKPAVPTVTVKQAAPVPQPIVVEGRAAIIASAALSQLGVRQDCTKLVTNALAAAGIRHHGWPVSYYNIGRPIAAAEAIPGDLVYYVNGGAGVAHIAVYIGNGQAVHGGWNGNQTVVFSANVGSGPRFIRV